MTRFERCSDAERANHLAYLEAHNPETAHQLQVPLRVFGWPLFAATISIAELGELETFWGNLGTETALAAIRRRWYRVQDGYAAITRACGPYSRDGRKVGYLCEMEAAGRLVVPRITLRREELDDGPNDRIFDGNHQAVAIFELRRRRHDAAPVRVYLVAGLAFT